MGVKIYFYLAIIWQKASKQYLNSGLIKIKYWNIGTSHGDDTRLLLSMLGTPKKLQENDEQMMDLFIEFLAGYARTG